MEVIRSSNVGNYLNKAGGIFIHNKATMDAEIKDLLIGISRVYVDKNNPLSSYAYNEKNFNRYVDLDDEGLDSRIALRNNSRFKDKYKDENTNQDTDGENIPYEVYDNDEEVINIHDLIKNINEPEDQDDIEDLEIDKKSNQSKKERELVYNSEISTLVDLDLDVSKDSNNYGKDVDEDPDVSDLDFFNGYGGFCKKDNSYIIKLSNYRNTPAPWINVISNDDFGFHISEVGSGYTWCGNSRENKITPWSNDYIRDPIGEALYIKDNDSSEYFSITPKPVRDSV